MSRPISANSEYGQQVTVMLDRFPATCPLCFHAIEPIGPFVSRLITKDGSQVSLELFFRCPNLTCQRGFLGIYSQALVGGEWTLSDCEPKAIVRPAVEKVIADISPAFVDIFSQAHEAELRNLTFISGPGYRKALEYLVKDYLILRFPAQQELIKKEQLGTCIRNRIDDANVKLAASRAAWLGNDESHYERKWPEKDITDLKRLIRLTENCIVNAELTRELATDMPDPTSSKAAASGE